MRGGRGLFALCALVAAVARAACPSVAACEQRYVSCSNTSLPALDPDFNDDDDVGFFYVELCLVVNCSGRAAQLQGEIPCDLPHNTWALLLADIGMTGHFSFQTLLERAPSMFEQNVTQLVVDLHDNALTGIQVPPASWWADRWLQASIDLSGNSITTIPQSAFQGATIYGNLDLSGNSITSIQQTAFQGAHISINLDLSANSITSVLQYAFQGSSIGNMDLSGNSITSIQLTMFSGAAIYGNLDLSGNNITSIQPRGFQSTTIHNNLDMSGNSLASVLQYAFQGSYIGNNLYLSGSNIIGFQPYAFFGATIGNNLDLSGNSITSIQQHAFSSINIGNTLDLSGNIISSIAGGHSGGFSAASIINLDLSGNRLNALQADTFAGLNINGNINLFNNNISVLQNGWYSAFPLEVSINMSGTNPSQCAVGELSSTVQTFKCRCADDSQSFLLGNGAYCDTTPCQHAELPANVAHGRITCPSSADTANYSSGQNCYLDCDRGYVAAAPFGSATTTITCLGGVWGQRPNLAHVFPTCVYAGFTLSDILIATLGGVLLPIVIAGACLPVAIARYGGACALPSTTSSSRSTCWSRRTRSCATRLRLRPATSRSSSGSTTGQRARLARCGARSGTT